MWVDLGICPSGSIWQKYYVDNHKISSMSSCVTQPFVKYHGIASKYWEELPFQQMRYWAEYMWVIVLVGKEFSGPKSVQLKAHSATGSYFILQVLLHISMVFEETITIEWFLVLWPLTQMFFQWSSIFRDHWSNKGVVSMDCKAPQQTNRHFNLLSCLGKAKDVVKNTK